MASYQMVTGTGTRNAPVLLRGGGLWLPEQYFLQQDQRDGSSRFGVNNKYANFYNVGAAWIISDESFFTSLKHRVNLLKYKISYGTVGKPGRAGDFASRPLFGKVNYAGTQVCHLPDPEILISLRSKKQI